MEKYIMALDQGTTSSRCIIFDKNANIMAQAQKEFTQIYPAPAWVEHDPSEIWSTQISVAIEAIHMLDIKASQIEGIGITNQRETTVVWNKKTGKAIYNAIVWQCRRTADIIDKMKQEDIAEYATKTCGLIPDAYFSASKIAWILDNVNGARELADKGDLAFGTIDSWLIYNLTGKTVHVCDVTNASRTMLFDIHNFKWDERLCEYFNIPMSMLPEVKRSSGVFGMTDPEIFGTSIPISGAAGDQQCALFGQCCFDEGELKNTYGTGGFLLMNTGSKPVESKNGLLTTVAATDTDEKAYALEGSIFIAGAGVQWLRDELKLVESSKETEEIAMSVPDTDGVYAVTAFTGLGAPYWNQYAKGSIVGITRSTKKEHVVRAVLEAMAYQSQDLIEIMEKDSGIEITSVMVDGGAAANNFLMQFQSDISGKEIIRPACVETTAMGAAFLAGLSVGFWKDKDEIKKVVAKDRIFSPQMDEAKKKELMKGWKRAVRCVIAWADDEG